MSDEKKPTLVFNDGVDGFEIDNLIGYRLTGVFQSVVGFGNNLFVYGLEQQPVAAPLSQVLLPTSTKAPRGKLTIKYARQFSTTFEGIDLQSVETVISHRERLRLFIFRLNLAGVHPLSATFESARPTGVSEATLGDNYTFSLDGFSEPLLGFSASQSKDLVALRFVSLLGSTNSWFKALQAVQSSMANGADLSLKVGFRMAKASVDLKPDNLNRLFVDESWGAFLGIPSPDVAHIVRACNSTTADQASLDALAVNVTTLSHKEFVAHIANTSFVPQTAGANCVQTAPLVLTGQGADKYRTLAVI